jgi:hypothetical protein
MKDCLRKLSWLLLILCCQPGFVRSQQITAGTVAKDLTMTCQSNPGHTYHIYIPAVSPGIKLLPLLVAIDPHGNGKLAVTAFHEAARKYNFVVAASDLIKNNDTAYIKELEELISDIKTRFPVSNVLLVGGFSGGARMSLEFAVSHPVDGVIACGALAKPEEIQRLKSKVISIIGMDDFNFIEAAPFVMDPAQAPSNLSVEITRASHEWPSPDLLRQSSGCLLLPKFSPDGNMAEFRALVREYVNEERRRIDSLEHIHENIQAAGIARNLMGTLMFEREGSFFSLYDELTQNQNYQSQLERLSKSIQSEIKAREVYLTALFQKDEAWWIHEIETLNSNIRSEKEEYTHFALIRIKGFLGIVCFSFCQRFETEKNAEKLEQVLMVYRNIEPKNTEMLRFTKVLERMKQSK